MDLGLALVVLVFALRGAFRGAAWQALSIVGLLAGLWVALWVSQWVGHHWHGARPAVIFWALRWLVALLAGFAVAALFEWWGQLIAATLHAGAAGWIDRGGGVVLGGALGLAVAAVLVLAAVAGPGAIADPATEARLARPLVSGGQRTCALGRAFFPGSGWLERRFESASRRVSRAAQS